MTKFLVWLLIFSWSMWLLRRLVGRLLQDVQVRPEQTASGAPAGEAPATARRLFHDPICGTHVDETLSIPFRDGDELIHFCSIACRDAYVQGTKRFAANA